MGSTAGKNETTIRSNLIASQEGAGPWGTLNWSYDLVGNRTSEVLTQSATTTWTYAYPSGSNKLATVTEGASVRTFTHDGGGNVTADDRVGTTYDYRYNKRGRLDQVSVGAQVRADWIAFRFK